MLIIPLVHWLYIIQSFLFIIHYRLIRKHNPCTSCAKNGRKIITIDIYFSEQNLIIKNSLCSCHWFVWVYVGFVSNELHTRYGLYTLISWQCNLIKSNYTRLEKSAVQSSQINRFSCQASGFSVLLVQKARAQQVVCQQNKTKVN